MFVNDLALLYCTSPDSQLAHIASSCKQNIIIVSLSNS